MRRARSGPKFSLLILLQPHRVQRYMLAMSIVLPLLIAGGSWLDGTLFMRSPAKGLGQHYGYWAFFITTPCIVFLTVRLLDSFTSTIQRSDQYCVGLTQELSERLDRLVKRHLRSLSLGMKTSWILTFIVFVFFCFWLLNVINTISPTGTYGHDVFDSYSHPYGYYTAKMYSLFVFTMVWATSVFFALHVTGSMVSVLRFLCRHDILLVDFFHADNCGGTSRFGNISLIILSIYANFFVIIYANYLTHRQTYFVMVTSLVAASVFALVQSIIAVYYTHRVVAQKKRECIEAVTARLNAQVASSLEGESFPNDLLAFRNHLIGLRTFPYTGPALIAVNVIRFAPVLLAFGSYIKHP